MSKKFNYSQIQGVKGNRFVTKRFITEVEKMSERLKTKPEYVLAAMSFETGGTFDPSIQNKIEATGLIQFIKSTAIGLGTTTDKLKKMTAVGQLRFVEKYFKRFTGKLETLEAVYTAILSGSPKKPNTILFKVGTPEYKLNPLDWNRDGKIIAAEATTVVWARLYGGVRKVQKRLVDLGLVPNNLKGGFADGSWGKNTSAILGEFQKSKGFSETGLLNEETGTALFPETKDVSSTKTFVLKRGDKNDDVKKLHDEFVLLGYMTMTKIGGGYGQFGPLTEAAVEKFQKDLKLRATKKFTDVEQLVVNNILGGITKGSLHKEIIKVIQDRLVKLSYMTQAQVNTGYGTFGNQTLAAIKEFQKDNMLQESGVIEAENFKILFNHAIADDTVTVAKSGKYYDVKPNILMTKSLQKKVAKLAKFYFEDTGRKITITSGYRTPERQASAMHYKIVNEGQTSVRNLYGNTIKVRQILAAYRANKASRSKAIAAMTKVIENQIKKGLYISKHLRSNAVDVRLSARESALYRAVKKVGGQMGRERDHYHLNLF